LKIRVAFLDWRLSSEKMKCRFRFDCCFEDWAVQMVEKSVLPRIHLPHPLPMGPEKVVWQKREACSCCCMMKKMSMKRKM